MFEPISKTDAARLDRSGFLCEKFVFLEIKKIWGWPKVVFCFVVDRGFVECSGGSGFVIVNVSGGKIINDIFNI